MAAWDRVSGIVLGVIGLHLFIYFATVSCVVSASADRMPASAFPRSCTSLAAAPLAALLLMEPVPRGSPPNCEVLASCASWQKQHSTPGAAMRVAAYLARPHSSLLSGPFLANSTFDPVPAQIVPWLSFSVPGVSHLLLLTGLVACSLACLVTAVVSDPGRCVHFNHCLLS